MKNIVKTGLYLLCSLVFCFLGNGCSFEREKLDDITVHYEFEVPKKAAIARRLLKGIPEDSIKSRVYFTLAKDNAPRILGDYEVQDKVVVFKPLIPFTPGLFYQLYIGGKKHSEIQIPFGDVNDIPVVRYIYPELDTLPENLLKIYIQFNRPMQEGVSAEHIFLLKEEDTLRNVFLDLQPELWNHERDILTVWLDPGRIKRDLQPNQAMGAPLVAGSVYELLVKGGWLASNGLPLRGEIHKPFVTAHRDTISPDPALWKVIVPVAGGTGALTIQLNDHLDYQLLLSSIRVMDSKGKEIAGKKSVDRTCSKWKLLPEQSWLAGTYTIGIESKLEDLAGNNLNRLFDTDLSKPQKKNQQEIYKLHFTIQ